MNLTIERKLELCEKAIKAIEDEEQPNVDALSADEGFVDRTPHANETPESLMLRDTLP